MEHNEVLDLSTKVKKRKLYLIALLVLIVISNIILASFEYRFEIACVIFMAPWLLIVIDKCNISLKLEQVLIKSHDKEFEIYKKHNRFAGIALNRAESFVSSRFFKASENNKELVSIVNSLRDYNKGLWVYLLSSYGITIFFSFI